MGLILKSNVNRLIEHNEHEDNLVYLESLSKLKTKSASFSGVVKNLTGKSRWYPENPIKITNILISIGDASQSDILVRLNKNAILAETLTLDALAQRVLLNLQTPILLDVLDFLTIDIEGSSGEGLVVTFYYEYQ